MADYPSRCVVDTGLLIDLYIGKIMVDFFKLPFDFVAPDVIVSELHEPNGKQPFQAINALTAMRERGSRFPQDEYDKHIRKWLSE